MLLAIDVGNTNIVLGVFDGDRLIESWRLATLRERTSDELGLVVDALFARSIVGEAKKHDGRILQRFLARGVVFTQRFGQSDDFEIVSPREPVANSQRGGSGLTVDIDPGSHL